ncbi:ATP-binding cassette domain-containing protein [Peribacillus butanolivorans]|uniref:ATP-binding cassette domain-containing protein n=1 Tax=Peribacillus butanolivorans TaxID=421767 RepID=UPI00366DD69B
MIILNSISKSYENKKILNEINFEFKKGNIYGLIGRNGAGKTTLLKIIMRIIKSHEGNVLFKGNDVNGVDTLDLPFVFIGDTPVLYQDLTAREQMLFICKISKLSKKDAIERINYLATELKLEEYLDYYPRSVSRGTLQRISIAIGMLRESNVYLFDEPFITLDPVQVDTVEKLFLNRKSENRVQIISSHDIDSLETICDKYLILKGGQLFEFDSGSLDRKQITKLIGDSYDD